MKQTEQRETNLFSTLFYQRGDQSAQRQTAKQSGLTLTGHTVRSGADGKRTCITYNRDKHTEDQRWDAGLHW